MRLVYPIRRGGSAPRRVEELGAWRDRSERLCNGKLKREHEPGRRKFYRRFG